MDWSFTDEQDQIAALTRQILERELTEERMREAERSGDRYDLRLLETLGEAGVLGVALPADAGGGALGLIEICRVLVECGRTVAPIPAPAALIGSLAVATFGSDELKARLLPDLASGSRVVVPALVEDMSLDPASPTTRAEPADGGWLLSGAKTTVAGGTIADGFLVPAATPDGPRVFVVEKDASGVAIERQKVTNTDAEAIVSLSDARASDVLEGSDVTPWLVRHLTIALCAVQLGVLERALELTAEYSKTRVQFERPIATFQAVGQRLADAYIDVNAVRLTTWQAAWRLSEGLPCTSEIATAKFWAADAGHRVAHTAVHVHGGMGIDLDYHLNRYFVAAKRIEFALGGATEQLVALGRELASEPA